MSKTKENADEIKYLYELAAAEQAEPDHRKIELERRVRAAREERAKMHMCRQIYSDLVAILDVAELDVEPKTSKDFARLIKKTLKSDPAFGREDFLKDVYNQVKSIDGHRGRS